MRVAAEKWPKQLAVETTLYILHLGSQWTGFRRAVRPLATVGSKVR